METAAHILPESKRMPPLYGDRSGGGRSTAGIGGTCHGTGMTYCRYWLAAARSHEFVHWENIGCILPTHDVTGSEGFLRCARHFFAGILTYFKEK